MAPETSRDDKKQSPENTDSAVELPSFAGFTFRLSAAEKQENQYVSEDTIKAIKYLHSLSDDVVDKALEEIRSFDINKPLGPTLQALWDEIRSISNRRWLVGEIIEIAYDRVFIDDQEQDELRENTGL